MIDADKLEVVKGVLERAKEELEKKAEAKETPELMKFMFPDLNGKEVHLASDAQYQGVLELIKFCKKLKKVQSIWDNWVEAQKIESAQKVREGTAAPIKDCKEALAYEKGSIENAIERLRKKGTA